MKNSKTLKIQPSKELLKGTNPYKLLQFCQRKL